MIQLSRKYYKVGATYGHMGQGKGIPIYIPIYAGDIIQAIKRAEMMGGLKKRFKYFWHVEEIFSPFELLEVRAKWLKFKSQMRRRAIEKKMRRRTG